MQEKPIYKDRIVGFIDILGFGTIISSLEKKPELHGRLHSALTQIKSYKMTSQMENTAHSDLEVSVFSDSIVMSADDGNLGAIIWASGWLNAQLLGFGILVRGGISSGKTFHANDILYGEGMMRAYRIESSAAVYPRIVVDPELVDQITNEHWHTFLQIDSDGLWYINPFMFNVTVENASELAADGYDPREAYLDELGRHIENGINDAKQLDHRAKWTWMKQRYKLARKESIFK